MASSYQQGVWQPIENYYMTWQTLLEYLWLSFWGPMGTVQHENSIFFCTAVSGFGCWFGAFIFHLLFSLSCRSSYIFLKYFIVNVCITSHCKTSPWVCIYICVCVCVYVCSYNDLGCTPIKITSS
jgi:hypothetical protein